jgi:hypothetical protein
MNRQERELRLVIREMINEVDAVAQAQQAVTGAVKAARAAFEDLADQNAQYMYRVFPNGALQIIKSPKNPKVSAQNPLTVTTKNKYYKTIIGSLKSLYSRSQVLVSAPFKAIAAGAADAAGAAAAALSPTPGTPTTTDPGALGTMAKAMGTLTNSVSVLDRTCAPSMIPLWVYPFFCFLVLRTDPLTITNNEYRQALHRICDAAWARGSRNLANPGDIQTAQNLDPVHSANKEGIVGANISFAKDWSQGYNYNTTNPYMHIAMSLTNFTFSKNNDGTYSFSDNYDFNEPGKVDPPLGNARYMLQNDIARKNMPRTVLEMFQKRGVFAAIEDLMRYYEGSLNYKGFQINGTTMIPEGYTSPRAPAAKKPAAAAAPKPKV